MAMKTAMATVEESDEHRWGNPHRKLKTSRPVGYYNVSQRTDKKFKAPEDVRGMFMRSMVNATLPSTVRKVEVEPLDSQVLLFPKPKVGTGDSDPPKSKGQKELNQWLYAYGLENRKKPLLCELPVRQDGSYDSSKWVANAEMYRSRMRKSQQHRKRLHHVNYVPDPYQNDNPVKGFESWGRPPTVQMLIQNAKQIDARIRQEIPFEIDDVESHNPAYATPMDVSQPTTDIECFLRGKITVQQTCGFDDAVAGLRAATPDESSGDRLQAVKLQIHMLRESLHKRDAVREDKYWSNNDEARYSRWLATRTNPSYRTPVPFRIQFRTEYNELYKKRQSGDLSMDHFKSKVQDLYSWFYKVTHKEYLPSEPISDVVDYTDVKKVDRIQQSLDQHELDAVIDWTEHREAVTVEVVRDRVERTRTAFTDRDLDYQAQCLVDSDDWIPLNDEGTILLIPYHAEMEKINRLHPNFRAEKPGLTLEHSEIEADPLGGKGVFGKLKSFFTS